MTQMLQLSGSSRPAVIASASLQYKPFLTALMVLCCMQSAYKDYVTAIILRRNSITNTLYRDDPNILAWDLVSLSRHSCASCVWWSDRQCGMAMLMLSAVLFRLAIQAVVYVRPPQLQQCNLMALTCANVCCLLSYSCTMLCL